MAVLQDFVYTFIIFAFITYLCIHLSDIEINTIKSHSLFSLSSPVVDDIYCSRVCLCARVVFGEREQPGTLLLACSGSD